MTLLTLLLKLIECTARPNMEIKFTRMNAPRIYFAGASLRFIMQSYFPLRNHNHESKWLQITQVI